MPRAKGIFPRAKGIFPRAVGSVALVAYIECCTYRLWP